MPYHHIFFFYSVVSLTLQNGEEVVNVISHFLILISQIWLFFLWPEDNGIIGHHPTWRHTSKGATSQSELTPITPPQDILRTREVASGPFPLPHYTTAWSDDKIQEDSHESCSLLLPSSSIIFPHITIDFILWWTNYSIYTSVTYGSK